MFEIHYIVVRHQKTPPCVVDKDTKRQRPFFHDEAKILTIILCKGSGASLSQQWARGHTLEIKEIFLTRKKTDSDDGFNAKWF